MDSSVEATKPIVGKWRPPSTKPSTAPARFMAKAMPVPHCGCWLWTGTINGNGYGSIHDGTRLVGAHRYSYMLHHGPIPKGMYVCHRCDTPTCVNPDHLFVHTPYGNSKDMVRKKRARSGIFPWAHSPELKAKVRDDPRPCAEITAEYGLTINQIKNMKSKNGKGFYRDRIEKIEQENARLRMVLAFYADARNYRSNAALDPNSSWFEGNTRAVEALAVKREE